MEGGGADVVAQYLDVIMLCDVNVGTGGPGGFGGTGGQLGQSRRQTHMSAGETILCGDTAGGVRHPVDLAGTDAPLLSQDALELCPGQAWRQAAADELEAWLGGLGTASRLYRAVFGQGGDRQDAR